MSADRRSGRMAGPACARRRMRGRTARGAAAARKPKRAAALSPAVAAPGPLDAEGQVRYVALKAWRAQVGQQHNLPAYVIFHDATLRELAQRRGLVLADFHAALIALGGATYRPGFSDDGIHPSPIQEKVLLAYPLLFHAKLQGEFFHSSIGSGCAALDAVQIQFCKSVFNHRFSSEQSHTFAPVPTIAQNDGKFSILVDEGNVLQRHIANMTILDITNSPNNHALPIQVANEFVHYN